ncbi:cytochrome D ubiquinol oxidase subunit I [Acidiphilium sp. AL]|uniref:Pyridoxal-dependent decarboxylase n=1 Tax=Acidiphilium iwatense TaxID=768198 RepID=A0ABS9DSE0_9PROT|nr:MULTISPECIES: pyridoxal-dependent decarboxylase [Acidiphilium]MCF3945110.1 pyridoxal-dependent decarboxylase [Acidiphilium iwatense]MCU4160545.1 cytochrome D ubiquinol oxidase subunit I [Acidiphilium sp. AL]
MTEIRTTLDPEDWTDLRALGHRMIDDMIDRLAAIRDGKVWQQMPDPVRAGFRAELPRQGVGAEAAYRDFAETIAPYASGNAHPRFMGWVQGGGNPAGMLAELLAGGLNENCGGRDHVGLAVERQVIAWSAGMLGLPRETGGLLVTGSSMANFISLLCARRHVLGAPVRADGLRGAKLVGYAQAGVHRCVPGAFDMAGLGTKALRRIPADADCRIDLAALEERIAADRASGMTPFFLVGTAGAVDTGAIDDLATLADIAARHGLWFHADAAFGALAALSPTKRGLLAGIERADSVAFDFHKWAQVQYDSGCILVRNERLMLDTFAQAANYLVSDARGLAGGAPWPCDLGPDLSRGFRALKVWMTMQSYGADRLGAVVDRTCALAQRLAARIDATNALNRLAPVPLNIVCFRYDDGGDDLDALNADIVADLQEAGAFVPSTTMIGGKRAIRAAIVNHRTNEADIDALAEAVIAAGQARRNRSP